MAKLALKDEDRDAIIDLVQPMVELESTRPLLVYRLGCNININYAGTPRDFATRLVRDLEKYGKIEQNPALWVLLERIRGDVGTEIEEQIKEIQTRILSNEGEIGDNKVGGPSQINGSIEGCAGIVRNALITSLVALAIILVWRLLEATPSNIKPPMSTSAPTDAPTVLVAPPATVPSAVPAVSLSVAEKIKLFRDPASLTLYIPAGETIDLDDWSLGTPSEKHVLSGYSEFGRREINGPACVRLEYAIGETPTPNTCPKNPYLVQQVDASGVFWHSTRVMQSYPVEISYKDALLKICGVGESVCEIPSPPN
jgi:hypothetical protein